MTFGHELTGDMYVTDGQVHRSPRGPVCQMRAGFATVQNPGHEPQMTTSPDQLFAYLDDLGISHPTISHPPLFTVEQSQSLRGKIAGGHTKNLFLRDKKQAVFLVVAEEDAEIDLKGLHRVLGASGRFSFGSPDLMRELLSVTPGSVTAFGVINDTQGRVTVILDAALMEHEIINAHPLVNTMTTSVRREDLVKFLEATDHSPRIERVSGLTPEAD
jgi:Ala-tRNA(Pro) deacylase